MTTTTYAGAHYDTAHHALTAAWLDLLTATGTMSPEAALLECAGDGPEEIREEAEREGWDWPGSPAAEDHERAFEAAIRELQSRAA